MTETIPAVLTDDGGATASRLDGYVSPGCVVDVSAPTARRADRARRARSWSAANAASRCSPDTSTTLRPTAASFRDGWFVTGDRAIARRRRARYYFAGRRSDVLKVAGENVSTVEVEQCLSAHPAVLEASVVGAPDPIRDEVPVAFVVAADPAHPPTVDELSVGAGAARQGQAPTPDHIRRRAAAHQRRQDPQVRAHGAGGSIVNPSVQVDATPEHTITMNTTNTTNTTIFTDELLASLDASTSDVAKASTLPAEIYTSEEFLAVRVRRAVRPRVAVRRAGLAHPQPWRLVHDTIAGEPLIIVRDKQGDINCLSAVCQHRAMQVCDGEGNSTTFKCPYHHWNYGLDGRLLGAPAMERTEGFDKKDFPLPRLRRRAVARVRVRQHGRRRRPAGSDADEVRAVPGELRPRRCGLSRHLHLTDLPWNWKVMFENFNDGYHANRLHQFVQDFCPSNMSEFPVEWDDASNVIFRAPATRTSTAASTPPIARSCRSSRAHRGAADALDVRPVPPTLCFGTAPDQCFFFLVRPKTANTIDVEIGYLFHPTALEDPLFEHKLVLSTPACRCSSARTRTPPPRCSADCGRGSRLAAATRGRRRATSTSTAGSSSATGHWRTGAPDATPSGTRSGDRHDQIRPAMV